MHQHESCCLFRFMKTLDLAADWFIEHCEHHRKLSVHTLKAYRRDLKHFNEFASKSLPESSVEKIDRQFVQNWLASMDMIKPRTVRRRLATLKSLFSSLERHG